MRRTRSPTKLRGLPEDPLSVSTLHDLAGSSSGLETNSDLPAAEIESESPWSLDEKKTPQNCPASRRLSENTDHRTLSVKIHGLELQTDKLALATNSGP